MCGKPSLALPRPSTARDIAEGEELTFLYASFSSVV
jgi:hypothetical protein